MVQYFLNHMIYTYLTICRYVFFSYIYTLQTNLALKISTPPALVSTHSTLWSQFRWWHVFVFLKPNGSVPRKGWNLWKSSSWGAFYLFIIYNPRYVVKWYAKFPSNCMKLLRSKVICKSMQIINWQSVTSWCSSKQSPHSIPWHCLLSKMNCTRRALDQPDSENDWMLTYCTNMSGGYLLHLDGNIDHNMLAKFALHFLKFNTERSLFWWIIKSKVWNIPLRSWPKVSVGSTLKHFSEARNSLSQQQIWSQLTCFQVDVHSFQSTIYRSVSDPWNPSSFDVSSDHHCIHIESNRDSIFSKTWRVRCLKTNQCAGG